MKLSLITHRFSPTIHRADRRVLIEPTHKPTNLQISTLNIHHRRSSVTRRDDCEEKLSTFNFQPYNLQQLYKQLKF